MKSLTYTEAREKLADTIRMVCENREPVLITRKRENAVVMISQEEYSAMQETVHLLRSPKNAQRLLESIEQLESGKGTIRELAAD